MGMQELMASGSREIFSRLGSPAAYSEGTFGPVDTVVIIRENVQVLGDFGQVVGARDEVSLLLQDIPTPRRNGVIIRASDSKIYTLVEKLVRDGYYEKWVVK